MSTTTTRLPLATADEVAAQVMELLKPHCHCERIHIAGSVRRRRPTPPDPTARRSYPGNPSHCTFD
jgi:DNA polymerase/3'-5' exonuclease PolX